MRTNRSYSTLFQILLVLGLLFLWVDNKPTLTPLPLSSQTMDEYFEELLEETAHGHLASVSLFCPIPGKDEGVCLERFFHVLGTPSLASAVAGDPFGWIMPLRI